MKKTLYILTFLLLLTTSYSQKEYHNWVFGQGCYITFNTPNNEPKFVDSMKVYVYENSSVISDPNGELQYYSSGNRLLDKNDNLLTTDIDGNISSMQGGCMFRTSDSIYYRVGSNFSGEVAGSNTVLSYVSIENKNGNVIISKNQIIDSSYVSEGLQLIKNTFNNKVYILSIDTSINGNLMKLYKFNDNDFTLLQSLELNQNFDIYNSFIKYSSSNNLIAINFRHQLKLQFLYFNQSEERIEFIENNSIIDTPYSLYSMEFSNSGNYLYCISASYNKTRILRVEGLNEINNKALAINSLDDINSNIDPFNPGQILLAPNRKIYIADNGYRYLSSIEYPDSAKDIGFVRKSINLENTYPELSLPNIPTSFYDFYDFRDSIIVCLGEDILLESKMNFEYDDTTYVWSGPNGFTSDLANPIIENAGVDDAGTYSVTIHNSDSSISYEREVVVTIETDIEDPEIIVVPDSIVCNTDEVKIVVVNTYENFEWSTGETTREIKVTESGKYSIEYTNDNGCVGYTEVNISFGEDITMDIIGSKEICEGSEEVYSADRDYETYLWSNGDEAKTTQISEAGKYWLEVTTAEGCTISDTIYITYHPNVIAELKPAPTTICEGDSVLLESKYNADYFEYLWNTGATTSRIYASETSTYKLTITDTRTGCIDSTEIAISVEDNLQPTIDGMNICGGNPATLEVLPNDPNYTYEWSNGETTPTIVVSQPATYTVTVSKDGCSGTAEFTVNESPNPEFKILGEDIVCVNTAMLSPDKDFTEYLWSTDEVTKEIEVTEAGTYSLTVTDENGCSATEEFTVNEQSLSFDISKDRIDFGKVYISETRVDSAKIINTSGFDITIQLDDEKYIILDGQTVQYNKTLDPTELGPYTDSFEYRVIEPCDTVITIPVTAEIYARVTISSDNIETEIGKEETIPVYLSAKADLSEQTYTITTGIDQSVLYTDDEFMFTNTAPINEAKTKVHEINGTIMLASELEYDITFPSYEFNNQYIEVATEQGSITIDSVCAFPLRAVTFTESTEMKVSPNPAKDKLVVDVTTGHFDKTSDTEPVEVGDGKTIRRFDKLSDQSGQEMQLQLISSEGRVAFTENWTQTASEKQLNINTDKIPSGLYQVRLQTPSGVLTENVIVVR